MGLVIIVLGFYWFGWMGGLVAFFLVSACQDTAPSSESDHGRLVAEPNTEDPGNRDWMNDFLRSRARAAPKDDAKALLPRHHSGWPRLNC
jgi:hypothetical protein